LKTEISRWGVWEFQPELWGIFIPALTVRRF
jgi:hypothetical protein